MKSNAKHLRARAREGTPRKSFVRGSKVDWRPAFLEVLPQTATYQAAASLIGISVATVWRERRKSPHFAESCDIALDEAGTRLKDEAVRRAVEGVPYPVFDRSTRKPIIDPETGSPYIERKYSDRLLILLLKARYPEEFAERCWRCRQVTRQEVVKRPARAELLKELSEARAAINGPRTP